jgi:DNA polymerase III epsilon subunit-like protein
MSRLENLLLEERAFKMRFLAIDFETNGLLSDDVLPSGAFPTQVSVTAYDPDLDQIEHLYDSYIHGAQSLSQWVLDNTHIRLELLRNAPPPELVSAHLASLWQEGDVVAAHNVRFDLDTVLLKIASQDHPFSRSQRLCTMSQTWCPLLDKPRFVHVCRELGVPYDISQSHSATHDSLTVAQCLQAAHRLGKPMRTHRVYRS